MASSVGLAARAGGTFPTTLLFERFSSLRLAGASRGAPLAVASVQLPGVTVVVAACAGGELRALLFDPETMTLRDPGAGLVDGAASVSASLQRGGEVTTVCLAAVVQVPGLAVGAAGTTCGTLCVFALRASPSGALSLAIVSEVSLARITGGAVSALDAVDAVGVGFDAAARLEFVAVAAARTLVLLDLAAANEAVVGAVLPGQLPFHQPPTLLQQFESPLLVASLTSRAVRLLVAPPSVSRDEVALIVATERGELRVLRRALDRGLLRDFVDHRRNCHSELQAGDESRQLELRAERSVVAAACTTSVEAAAAALHRRRHVRHSYELLLPPSGPPIGDSGALVGGVCVNDAALLAAPFAGFIGGGGGDSGASDVVVVGALESGPRETPAGAAGGFWAALPAGDNGDAHRGVLCACATGTRLGLLPAGRHGLALVRALAGRQFVVAAGAELHCSSLAAGGAAFAALRHCHTFASVISDVCVVSTGELLVAPINHGTGAALTKFGPRPNILVLVAGSALHVMAA